MSPLTWSRTNSTEIKPFNLQYNDGEKKTETQTPTPNQCIVYINNVGSKSAM